MTRRLFRFIWFGFVRRPLYVVYVSRQTDDGMKWNICDELNEREYLLAMIAQKNRLNQKKKRENFHTEDGRALNALHEFD